MKYVLNFFFFSCFWLLVIIQFVQVYELRIIFEVINLEGEGYNDFYIFMEVLVDLIEIFIYREVLEKGEEFKVNIIRKDNDVEKVFWVKL